MPSYITRLRIYFLSHSSPEKCDFPYFSRDPAWKRVWKLSSFVGSWISIWSAQIDFVIIPIEFYAEFNLSCKRKSHSERNQDENKSTLFLIACHSQWTELFAAKQNRISKRIRNFFLCPMVILTVCEYQGKMLVTKSWNSWKKRMCIGQ